MSAPTSSSNTPATQEELDLAVRAAALYLLNILLLPGIAFVLLLAMLVRHHQHPSALVRNHLEQALRASLYAGFMLVLVSAMVLLYGDIHHVHTWMGLILYVLCLHSVFILFGVLALSHAQAGRLFRYPLIGGAKLESQFPV